MKQGKQICKTLKEIRLKVARANDIPYEPTECKHKGDCLGTCPKCEEEVRYIEQQLDMRRMLGKAATVAGVAMGVGMAMQPAEAFAQCKITIPQDSIVIDSLQTLKVKSLLDEGERGIVIRGRVTDGVEPIIGAAIIRKGTKRGETTNIDGLFAVEVPENSTLEVSMVGFETLSLVATKERPVVEVALEEDANLQGEVVIMGIPPARKPSDDVYERKK